MSKWDVHTLFASNLYKILYTLKHNLNEVEKNVKSFDLHVFINILNEKNIFSDGCLGSRNDEERSEMRYVMRIADLVNHQNFERTLHNFVVCLLECLMTSIKKVIFWLEEFMEYISPWGNSSFGFDSKCLVPG